MKKIYVMAVVLVVIAIGALWPRTHAGIVDFKKATYLINGKPATVGYFGNEVRHDLDGDGREDVAFIATVSPGGGSIFYYVVAALNKPEGYIGSDDVLLGDRIAPQTTTMDERAGRVNVIVVNYADRKPGDSMTTPPSVGKSIWLKLDPKTMRFGEVAQNFEGESAR